MSTETAIALIPQIDNPNELFVAHGLDPLIDNITAQVEGIRLDISTEQGRKEVASVAYRVARSKNAIDEAGKKLAEGIKAQAKIIDAERKRAWERLEALQLKVREPLTQWEEREKTRVAKFEADIAAMESLRNFNGEYTSKDIEARLAELATFKGREWDEFRDRAKVTHGATAWVLTQKLEAVQKAESERAELERLRKEETARLQKERDERLQAEAAERARVAAEAKAKVEADALAAKVKAEAERIERAKIEAIERVERERKAAEDRAHAAELRQRAEKEAADDRARKAAIKAKADAEAAVQKERERVEAQRKADAAIERKRAADKQHKAKIEGEAFDAMINELDALGETHDAGEGDRDTTNGDRVQAIIEAIADGRIPHVSIKY